jgi:hypothetical protein
MSAHGRIRHPFCGTSIVPFDANGLGRPKAFESMPRCKTRTSPRAAAACVREKLMVAAKAEPGSSSAITMHNTKRMMHLRFLFSR